MQIQRTAQVALRRLQVELPVREGYLDGESPIRPNAVQVLELREPSISQLQLH